MAPLIPRMHVFEIDDQAWFPPWFRSRVQAALTQAWVLRIPVVQRESPASLVAGILEKEVLQDVSSKKPWVMIDFCAGGGGPSPSIERLVNAAGKEGKEGKEGRGDAGDAEAAAAPTQFVLTDVHPHVDDWALAAAASPNVRYSATPVDAAAADPARILKEACGMDSDGVRVMRLFNLAFHHIDDPLAKAMLRDTVETSDGFGIFELQDRSLSSFVTTLILGLGILLTAPYYAWKWRSPMTLVFTYLIPILPFVLVFDGWMSMLRTRTPGEVDELLRTCGADTVSADGSSTWELRSGEIRHLWPCGYLMWIVCTKKAHQSEQTDVSGKR